MRKAKTITVVELSKDPRKDRVNAYQQQFGYRILPINPFADQILGEESYKCILDIPLETQKIIDIIAIFRKSEDVTPIVEQAIQLKTKVKRKTVFWMRLGIVNEQADLAAQSAGLIVIMNKCLMVEHQNMT